MERKFKVEVDKSGFKDITLVCKDCGEKFVYTAGDQAYYAFKRDDIIKNGGVVKDFPQPKRCRICATIQRYVHAKTEEDKKMYMEKLIRIGGEAKYKLHLERKAKEDTDRVEKAKEETKKDKPSAQAMAINPSKVKNERTR